MGQSAARVSRGSRPRPASFRCSGRQRLGRCDGPLDPPIQRAAGQSIAANGDEAGKWAASEVHRAGVWAGERLVCAVGPEPEDELLAPHAAAHVSTNHERPRGNLRHHDSVIRTFREAGFSIKQAIHAFSVLDSYISGFALQELTMPFDTPEELTEAAESILGQFPADEYPHLAETITEHVTKSGYDYADEFQVGLDLILDAIERLRDRA
jgi:hypothetical protein